MKNLSQFFGNSGDSSPPAVKIRRTTGRQIVAKLSFLLILVAFGIPLWWKLTEVERYYFPYSDIKDIRSKDIRFLVNICIHSRSIRKTQEIAEQLLSSFSSSKLYVLNIKTYTTHNEDSSCIRLQEIDTPGERRLVYDRNGKIYFSSDVEVTLIHEVVKSILFEKELLEAAETIVSIEHRTAPSKSQLRRLRPSTQYDIVFTTVLSEPGKCNVNWDQKNVLQEYFEPFLKQLSKFADFNIRSQWLFEVNLGVIPKEVQIENKTIRVFQFRDISQIVTPLENHLGSGVAERPCVNFVLYITNCSQTPVYFANEAGIYSLAAMPARWGGIQILNPRFHHCHDSAELVPNPKVVTDIFIQQFKLLLGFPNLSHIEDLEVVENLNPDVVTRWETESLYRMRILELFVLSRLTLSSLSELLEEIKNIVITENVSKAVVDAVDSTNRAIHYSLNGNLDEALEYAKKGFESSEYAFTHPSLLALLNFPDDQKYAVYVPLYLPIMIPVLFSLNSIKKWISKWRKGLLVIDEESSDESDTEDAADDSIKDK